MKQLSDQEKTNIIDACEVMMGCLTSMDATLERMSGKPLSSLTMQQAAERLGVSTQRVQGLVRRGVLEPIQFKPQVLFSSLMVEKVKRLIVN